MSIWMLNNSPFLVYNTNFNFIFENLPPAILSQPLISNFTSIFNILVNENALTNQWNLIKHSHPFLMLSTFSTNETTIPAAEKTLIINKNFSWNAIVANKNVKDLIVGIPDQLDHPNDFIKLLDFIDTCNVCLGICDDNLVQLSKSRNRNGVFKDRQGKVKAQLTDDNIIRPTDCSALVKATATCALCECCISYYLCLLIMLLKEKCKELSQLPKRPTNTKVNSHCAWKHLTEEEHKERVSNCTKERQIKSRKISRLEKKFQKDSIALQSDDNDGASPHRTFYKYHCPPGNPEGALIYKTPNPYAEENCPIFFICDPVHLLKTTCNNWENSFLRNKTKKLRNNDMWITWLQLIDAFENDVNDSNASGLQILHKLNTDHLFLNPHLRMRVYLAAQVLSNRVACAMTVQGKAGTEETAKFVQHMNDFFDCLNANKIYTKFEFKSVYCAPDDRRLVWLKSEFLKYFQDWEKWAMSQTFQKKNVRNISLVIRHGKVYKFALTLVEVVQFSLQIPGVCYVVATKFNQDPIETFFGKLRQQRGAAYMVLSPLMNFNKVMLVLPLARPMLSKLLGD